MPDPYQRSLPNSWWLRKGSYLLFMIRELTSVFVAGYAVFLLVFVARANDPDSFSRFFASLRGTPSMILQGVVLAMTVFHAVTWINLTPKVLVLWRKDEQVSPRLVAAANYVAWALLSAGVTVVVLR